MTILSLVQPCARCRHARTCAGSFPGMWYYLSLFYCDKDLGMAYSWVSVGTAFSQVTAHVWPSGQAHSASQTLLSGCQPLLRRSSCPGKCHPCVSDWLGALRLFVAAGDRVAPGSWAAGAGWGLRAEGLPVALPGGGVANCGVGHVHPQDTGGWACKGALAHTRGAGGGHP